MTTSKDCIVVNIVTHDERAVIKSMIALMTLPFQFIKDNHFTRNIYINEAQGFGISMVRTKALRQLKERFPGETNIWVLWLDSDIKLDPAFNAKLAELIIEAERTGLSFAPCVKTLIADESGHPRGNVFRPTGGVFTDEELKEVKDFELKLSHTGLAFAYVYTPVNYDFHDEGMQGEDVNFFKDNPQIDLRYAALPNRHLKQANI